MTKKGIVGDQWEATKVPKKNPQQSMSHYALPEAKEIHNLPVFWAANPKQVLCLEKFIMDCFDSIAQCVKLLYTLGTTGLSKSHG